MSLNKSCPNGYNAHNFASNFFVNEKDSDICSKCSNFSYKNGIATCDLLTGISESTSNSDINIITERL